MVHPLRNDGQILLLFYLLGKEIVFNLSATRSGGTKNPGFVSYSSCSLANLAKKTEELTSMRQRFYPGLGLVLILPLVVWAAGSRGLEPLVKLLASTDDTDVQRDILRGIHASLQGRRQLQPPPGWAEVAKKLGRSTDAEVREKTLLLSVLFGDPGAIASLRRTAADAGAELGARRNALQTLVDAHVPDLLPILRALLDDSGMRRWALQALATIRDPETPSLILKHYPAMNSVEKTDALATLSLRPEWALALLDAIEAGKIASRDLSPFTVKQMLNLNNKMLSEKIAKVWGKIQPANLSQLPRYAAMVPPEALRKADRPQGRVLYNRFCASCHTLFNEGGKIGPDLTGSQRTNPDYILTKLLAPSAVVARDYLMTIVTTSDGRSISGIVKEENEKIVVLQTATLAVRIPKSDIEERTRSNQSLMPEGMLAPLSEKEVRDLIGYLAGPDQVSLPK
jgi:putative heme-binding domain-containing protein